MAAILLSLFSPPPYVVKFRDFLFGSSTSTPGTEGIMHLWLILLRLWILKTIDILHFFYHALCVLRLQRIISNEYYNLIFPSNLWTF